jgi:hypothetical protein
MSRLFNIAAAAALTLTNLSAAPAQTAPDATRAAIPRAAQQHLIGEVTLIDAATGRITVKSDAGAAVEVTTDEKTLFRRIPPGQTALDKAEPITRADVSVGDRVLVPNGAAGGTTARQVIIMARAALAEQREREREERRRRTLTGRVTAVDAARGELTVQARGREGVQAVTVASAGTTRFLRYAPDSLRTEHARAGSLADVRVGDQFRATGDRDAAGTRFTAEEVITGTVSRVFGQIVSVDAARGKVSVRNELMGETFTVTLGQHTTLRRVTPEVAERIAQQRAERGQRRERRAGREDSTGGTRAEGGRGRGGEGREGREGRGPGGGGRRGEGRGPGAGGGNFQMFENLPAITAAELKKGDAVIITGTAGADATHLTAVSLITGDAELLRSFQGGGERNMSPGLPGNVMGGGTGGTRDQP